MDASTQHPDVHIALGIDEQHRHKAAELYDQAFGEKLALAIPDRSRRITLFRDALQLDYAIAATSNSELVGLAGYSTAEGSLTGGISYRDLIKTLGFWGGHRAVLVLALYDRTATPGQLLMDGIVVDAACRGQGVGSKLFQALFDHARELGYKEIRLDVIDTNDAAKRLYLKLGFKETGHERFEFLRGVLGFGGATSMVLGLE